MMLKPWKNNHGAVLILVTLLLFVFVGVAALAVDLGHLYMVRNELQNAADAGALAGAANLYVVDADNSVTVNPNANLIAWEAATANRATAKEPEAESNYLPVEVDTGSGGNLGDVQRGHWSFSSGFTPNPSLAAVSQDVLWNSTFAQLDANPDLINAVRVTTRREENPATSFFARIFGYEEFFLSATAVAYLGFASTINPGEVNTPLAICRETIENNNGELQCNLSRLINSSEKDDANTAGWTNFSQDTEYWAPQGCFSPSVDDILGTENNPNLVCGDGNPKPIVIGKTIGVDGGHKVPIFEAMRSCWESYQADQLQSHGKYMPMEITVVVVECGSEKIGNAKGCLKTFPPVKLEIVWITPKTFTGPDKWAQAPKQMEDWSSASTDGSLRWKEFVQHFQIKAPDGQLAYEDYYPQSIYAKPNCEELPPMGTTGGTNSGVLARIPVLVK
jgi:Flp pilus assembly protein TadG